MAEAFGLAAAVLQVAQFGTDVGSTLWRCAKKFHHASKELEEIAHQVETIALSLRQVNALLQDPATRALHTHKLYEDTTAVLDGCNEVFRELNKYIKGFEAKSSLGKLPIWSKARWMLDSDKLQGLGQVLRRYNDVLHLMVSVMAIVEGRRAATKDELQALEAHLQILAISNRDLSQSNKSLTDTIAAISRTHVEPNGSKGNVSSLSSTANTLDTTGALHITSFTAMPAKNSFPAIPRQPDSHLEMTDHLQRCLKSVQDLAQTIKCALNALHGHEKTGSSDVHGSYAKLAANLDQLPTNVQCVHCQRKIALSHFECAKDSVFWIGACVCMSSTYNSPSLWAPGDLPGRHERQRGESAIASGSTDLTTGNERANIAHSTRLRFPDHPAVAHEQRETVRPTPVGPRPRQQGRRRGARLDRSACVTQDSVSTIRSPAPEGKSSDTLADQDQRRQSSDLEMQNKTCVLVTRQEQDHTLASPGVAAEADLGSITDPTPFGNTQQQQNQNLIELEQSWEQQPSIAPSTSHTEATVNDTAFPYMYDTWGMARSGDIEDWEQGFGSGQAQPSTSGRDWYCPFPSGEDVPRPLTQDPTSPPHTIAGEAKIGLVDPSLIQPFDPVQRHNAQYPNVPAIQSPQGMAYPTLPSPEPAHTCARRSESTWSGYLPRGHTWQPEPLPENAKQDSIFTPVDESRSFLDTLCPSSAAIKQEDQEDSESRPASMRSAVLHRCNAQRTLSEPPPARKPHQPLQAQANLQPPRRVASTPSLPSTSAPARHGTTFEPVSPFDIRSSDFSHISQSIPSSLDDVISYMQPVYELLDEPMDYTAEQQWLSFDTSTIDNGDYVELPLYPTSDAQSTSQKRSRSDAFPESVANEGTPPPSKRRDTSQASGAPKSCESASNDAVGTDKDEKPSSGMATIQALLSRWVDSSAATVLFQGQ